MIEKLEYKVEQKAENAENLSFCRGLKLLNIKDQIAQMLSVIGTNGIFEQYTKHDISHINQMLIILEWLIPESTQVLMTDAEWLMLTLAVYCHDLGMVVSKSEYEQRNNNQMFLEFKAKMQESASTEYQEFFENEKNLYQEFVRKYHACRVKCWLENKSPYKYGVATEQVKILNQMFAGISDFDMFKRGLGLVCESHHLNDLEHFEKYKIAERYGSDKECVVNLNYICILLRIADLLHITNDRTPTIPRMLIDISNPISVLEWEKQRAVKAIAPQTKRNDEGRADDSLLKDTIEITAYFSGSETANAYFGLSSYLQYVREELLCCYKITKAAQVQEGSRYEFPWIDIDEKNIITDGFETKKLSFSIEQENILNLLVGHTLYNDSSVAVRELTQNAIDAIKLQRIIDAKENNPITDGKVLIKWDEDSRILTFCDNGTGMTLEDIENYLLKVGASKYRQKTFEKEFKGFNPISRFGIGILTCFMLSNDISIETNSTQSNEVNRICLRQVTGNYLIKKASKAEASQFIKEHGTIIELHIRSEVDMSGLEDNLKKWVVVSEIPILLEQHGNCTEISARTAKNALINFLKDAKINVDGKTIKVEEKTAGNVTVACALSYNKYLSDWSFLNTRFISNEYDEEDIVGTCVEGIRVEFSSPGFVGCGLVALANISGSKFQTNVARTALEYDVNQDILKSIYDCYRLFVQEQIDNLKKLHYSESWAVNEGIYLTNLISGDNYYRNDSQRLINKDLFYNAFSSLKILFVENKGCREMLSINELNQVEAFDTFEFELLQLVERLFIETDTNTTVTKTIEAVCGKNEINSEYPVITNFNKIQIFYGNLLKDRQVSHIVVDPKKRKIQLTIEKGDNIWLSIYDYDNRRTNSYDTINFPKNDFQIEGLNSEIGVQTSFGVFLNSDSNLCKYIKKLFELFKDKTVRDKEMLTEFLAYIFKSGILSKKHQEKDIDHYLETIGHPSEISSFEFLNRNPTSLPNKIWDIIDVNEFKDVILMNNYSLFSLNNWSRSY